MSGSTVRNIAISKVRIEFEDGTYVELNGVEDCAKWDEMVSEQAIFAFIHGVKFDALPWKGTGTDKVPTAK